MNAFAVHKIDIVKYYDTIYLWPYKVLGGA